MIVGAIFAAKCRPDLRTCAHSLDIHSSLAAQPIVEGANSDTQPLRNSRLRCARLSDGSTQTTCENLPVFRNPHSGGMWRSCATFGSHVKSLLGRRKPLVHEPLSFGCALTEGGWNGLLPPIEPDARVLQQRLRVRKQLGGLVSGCEVADVALRNLRSLGQVDLLRRFQELPERCGSSVVGHA